MPGFLTRCSRSPPLRWPPSTLSVMPFTRNGTTPSHRATHPITDIVNPDKGFSGCGLETIAGLKVALGLERVDLIGGNGRNDVNEGIDDGSMPGQIEGRELLDLADVGHVPGIQQGFIV